MTIINKAMHIMKPIQSLPAAAAAALTLLLLPLSSCSKERGPEQGPLPDEGQALVTLSVSPDPGTKALGIADDTSDTRKVNSLQVFAFDSDGALQAYGASATGGNVSMKLNIGQEYTFRAVANNRDRDTWKYSAIADVKSEDGFPAIMTDLRDNAKSDLLMYSQEGTRKTVESGTSAVEIGVSRLVSKIEIRKITADFGTNEALKARSFMIDSIYVINAVRGESLSLEPDAQPSYYNLGKFVSGGGADLLLGDRLGTSFELSTSAGVSNPYTTPHTFFAYGNATPHPTRLVVSCRWGDRRTFYPVDITGEDGSLKPGCAYIIRELTIRGLGSDDPDVAPERREFGASVTITDWGTGFEKNVTL